jgi:hypothetical protein
MQRLPISNDLCEKKKKKIDEEREINNKAVKLKKICDLRVVDIFFASFLINLNITRLFNFIFL